MPTSFPGSQDNFTNPAANNFLNSPSHSAQHANANDAIEALEAKVGSDGSAVTTSHDYKLSGVTGTDKAASLTGTEVLTNKTLTSPTVNTPTITNPVVSYSSLPSTGAVPVKLAETVVGALGTNAIDWTGISQNYRSLRIIYAVRSDQAGEQAMGMRFNNDSTANYDGQFSEGSQSVISTVQALAQTSIGVGTIPGTSATSGYFGQGDIDIPMYTLATSHKISLARCFRKPSNTASAIHAEWNYGAWRTVAAVNRITLFPPTGNFVQNSVFVLYGMP